MRHPLYLRYLSISVKGQLQYKASFILQSIGQLFVSGLEFLGLWALFDRFGNLKGWTLPEAAFFYGLVNVSFAIADAMARGFDVFGSFVKSGEFDRLLLRPRSTVLQLAGHELTLRRLGRLAQGLAVFVWAVTMLQLDISIVTFMLLCLAIAGTVALFIGLVIMQAGICFWTTESLEIMNILTYGGVQTAQYPISVYRKLFRRFFMFVVPLGSVCYFPAVRIIGKVDPLGFPGFFAWISPIGGLLFLLIALLFWRFAQRRYTSTGS